MVYHATSFFVNSQAMLSYNFSLSNRRRRLDEVKGAWIHECKQEAPLVGRWRHSSAHSFTPLRLSSSSFFTNNTNQLLQHISSPTLKADAVFNPISSLRSYPLEESASKFQDAFWRFLRPHTIRGTLIATTSLVIKTLVENSDHINWSLLPRALCGLLALLCGNGYIVGINQIYDVSIDKVNKPFLPIAAGDFSIQVAWVLVVLLALAGIGLVATNFSPLIAGLYVFGLFLGSIYSVPPLRLKRFPVAAFIIIATARGFLLNFGVYHATRAALGLPFVWSPSVIFITIFVTLFATVIAITKDLPDIEGDRKFDVPTFATKAGTRNIALLGSSLLLANYIGAMAAAYIMPLAFRRGIMMFGHLILATSLIYQTWLLHISNYTKVAIMAYYRFIWTLFYAEYALFPFI